jgi:acetylornithine deacetylase/succinyl-diaminopimelate desuccinylase-like protein
MMPCSRKVLALGWSAGLLILMSGQASAQVQSDPVTSALIEKHAQASFREFFEFLLLPNDAIVPADIQKNADWLEAAFAKRGFTTKQLPNDGKPLVFAEYGRKLPNQKTVLFYMHFDGQPVIPSQWSQKSPWAAVLRQRRIDAAPPALRTMTPSRAGATSRFEDIDAATLESGRIDPEWRIFARSSSDDKGPIMMFLTAFDALRAAGIEPAVNVKVLLDSEEEKGSPTIGKVVTAHREMMRADALLIHDGPMHASNQPTIIFGNRGNTVVQLTVYGPKSNLHSGHYGNYAPNPAQRLAALLATMKDDDGRVTIAGYYDSVKLKDSERSLLAAVPDNEAELLNRLGIHRPEKVGANLQEALQYPSLNIRGMQAAAVGDKGANIIPSHAVAELDLRTTPGATPAQLAGLIEKHIRDRGYHLTAGEPTDEERARHDKIASLKVARGSEAAFTEVDSPVGNWVQGTFARTFARDGEAAKTVRIRMMGGSVPTDKLVQALNIPFVIVPLVNPDNNQHSFDENLRLGHYLDGIRAMTGLLRSPLPK